MRRCRVFFLLKGGFVMTMIMLGTQQLLMDSTRNNETYEGGRDLKEIPTTKVGPGGLIITPAVIDKGYLAMALNFYYTSILPHGLKDITLFMCVDKNACAEAEAAGLPVYLYKDYSNLKTNDFNTVEFNRKAMLKHYIVHDIINMGFTVLLTDTDMFWFRNPVAKIVETCGDCDFACSSETGYNFNTGLILVRPTQASKNLYKKLLREEHSERKGALTNQVLFNTIVYDKSQFKLLKPKTLNLQLFPDGNTYFQAGNRLFPHTNPCHECFICHNNWLVGTEAKVYRFREHGMWMVDREAYYSNPNRKYLMYENVHLQGHKMAEMDLAALKAAMGIGEILGRAVILPRSFHKNNKKVVPLNGILAIRTFESVFEDLYRESTFLEHPYVPLETKDSICGDFIIKSGNNTNIDFKKSVNIMVPKDSENGATSDEIEEYFTKGPYKNCKVIKFSWLYKAFKKFSNETIERNFNERFNRSYRKCDYNQLDLIR